MPISSSVIGVLLAFVAQAEMPLADPLSPSAKRHIEKFDDWSGMVLPGTYNGAGTWNEARQNFNIVCEGSGCVAGFSLGASCRAEYAYGVRIETTSGTFEDMLVCMVGASGMFQMMSDKIEPYRNAIDHGGQMTLSIQLQPGKTQTARFSLKGAAAAMAWSEREIMKNPAAVAPEQPPTLRTESFGDWQTDLTTRSARAFTQNDAGESLLFTCDGSGCIPSIRLWPRCTDKTRYKMRIETRSGAFDDELTCRAISTYFVFVSDKNEAYRSAIARDDELTISYEMHDGEKRTARFSLKGGAAATAWVVRESEPLRKAAGSVKAGEN